MISTVIPLRSDAWAPRSLVHSSNAGASQPALGANVQRLIHGVPVPAIVLAPDRCIVARNVAAEVVPDLLACVALSYGRVTRFAGAATEPFERVFARALGGVAASAVVTLPCGSRKTLWRLSFGRIDQGDGVDGVVVLMLIDPPADSSGTLRALQRLFALTAAEARVLALLMDDCRPREIAGELGISITTVRSHLQALFAKTGTRRQSELVALAWSAA